MDFWHIFIYSVSFLFVLLGLVGTILPMLPGVPLVFIGSAILAFYTQFSLISPLTLIIFFVLMIISLAIDYFSGLVGAKYSGASLWAMIGAFIGAIIGALYFGVLGLIFAPAISVMIFELIQKKSVNKSARSASYTFFSTVFGMVLNGAIALVMLVIFLLAVFI